MRTRRQPPETRRHSQRGKPKVGDLAARIENTSGSRDSPRRYRSCCDAQTEVCWCRLLSGLGHVRYFAPGESTIGPRHRDVRPMRTVPGLGMGWPTMLLRTTLVQEVPRSSSSWCQHERCHRTRCRGRCCYSAVDVSRGRMDRGAPLSGTSPCTRRTPR
ncbi:hypothetical protein K525DRAFT_204084 [Schizophyllum commune Loenen D]|nr:hypothetical protein K525DRAFT_204084 [Schizophyllum commune Loenen D]